jgi:hypothetical protein
VFCAEVQRCMRSTECPRGYACITENGCTGCDVAFGVCSKKCKRGLADGRRRQAAMSLSSRRTAARR